MRPAPSSVTAARQASKLPPSFEILSARSASCRQRSQLARTIRVIARSGSKAEGVQGVSPTPGSSIHLKTVAPAAGAGVLCLFLAWRFLQTRRSQESPLKAAHGIGKSTTGAASGAADYMQDVNTVAIQTLTKEQISAARERRRKESAAFDDQLDMDDLVIPDNHPWATPTSKLSRA